MHYIRISRVGKTACAVVLSCLLAAGPLMDSAPFYAFADEGTADVPATESDPARETAPEEEPQKHEQVNEDKPLAPDATQNQAPADKKPVEEGGANALPEGEADTSTDGNAADVPSSPTVVNPGRVGVDVPLAQGEEVVATAGTVIVDGLNYVVNSDGGTATVAGCVDPSAPKGDVIVAATVFSGSDEYLVTAVADEAFKDCEGVESVVLPDTLESFGKDVFKGCSSLQRIEVGERSKLHAVHDGMLFDKELSTLLVCPEGKQPVASLPDSMTSFADDAFAGCRNLEAFQVEEGNQTFASVDGVLYSADRTRLVMAPARTVSVIVDPETNVIAAGAFSACSGLASIIANGYVETIEGKAFSLETLSKTMVALASGDDYDARKAVWDEAGFTSYIEPAVPGEIQQPAPTQSGFMYELLDDYTLAVSWTGENDPDADLVIPATAKLDGVEYRVSAIAPAGFQGRQSLTSVQIRAPITAIGDDAFAGCTGLASVELSEGVSVIGAGAFSGTAVQRVVIPASVTSVGSRAFADCPDLSRIVTFSNAPSVAADAIAGCTSVAIYAPYNEAGEYSWNPGLVASGNHILPYGISLASDPLTLGVDETADLFEGGVCEVPEECELTYSYAATPISVEAGQVTGKKFGTSEVTVALSLDGVELGRSVRVVEVAASSAVPRARPTEASVSDFDVMPVIGMADGVSGTCFWALDGAGKLTISPNDHISGILADLPASSSASPWSDYSGSVRNVEIRSRVKSASSLNFLFFRCSNMTSIAGLENLDTSSATNMSTMFNGCSSLLSLDVSGFETANTQNMSNMFNGCSRLTSLDLSSWNTTNATNMNNMFSGCANLATISIGENFSKVLTGMINNVGADLYVYGAPSIIQSSSAYTGTVHLMTAAASGAKSKWTSAGFAVVDEYADAFAKGESGACSWTIDAAGKLSIYPSDGVAGTLEDMMMVDDYSKKIPWYSQRDSITSAFIAPGVKAGKGISYLFSWCKNLTSIEGLSNLDMSNATETYMMFNSCSSLATLDLSSWDVSGVMVMRSMFNGCSALTSLNLAGWNTSRVKDMSYLFSGCSSLKSLDVSRLITTNVTEMRNIFSDCSSLQAVDVSGFNTSNLSDLYYVFNGCFSLASLDIGDWDVSNVKNMGGAFRGCSSLKSLDVSKWDTSNATSMTSMFANCSELSTIDVSNFKTSQVSDMRAMFQGCRKVEKIDVANWDTSSAGYMSVMFNACELLSTLDLSRWSTSNVTEMYSMFHGCKSLTKLDLSKFETSKVTNMKSMFYNCSSIAFVDLSGFNTSNVTNSTDMFVGCPNLSEAKVGIGYTLGFLSQPSMTGYNGNWTNSSGHSFAYNAIPSGVADTYKAELATYSITYELNGGTLPNDAPTDYTIKSPDITLPTPSLAGSEFLGWYESADFAGDPVTAIASGSTGDKTFYAKWNRSIPSDVKDSGEMGGVTWYITADDGLVLTPTNGVEGTMDEITTAQPAPWIDWKPSVLSLTVEAGVKAGKSLSGSFSDCANLASVDVSGFDTSNTENMSFMFASCMKLQSLDLSHLDTSKVTDMYALFSHCESMTGVNLSGLDTSKVIYMHRMFNECHSLKALDLSGFNTSSIRDMDHMFNNCVSLESLDMPGWTIANVDADMGGMFENCTSLPSLDVSTWTVSGAVSMYATFKGCASIASLDLSGWDTSKATNAAGTFEGCSSLTDVKLPDGFVSATVTDASKLFFDCPKLTTIPANLSFPESAPTAQAFGFSEAPAEFVATTYAGDDSQLLAYDWIADCRLLNGMEAFGELPTVDNLGRAWWSVDTNGTLTIGCEEGSSISSLGWSWQIANNTDYWSPFRDQIVAIEMSPTVHAETMAYWFQGMHKLTDISGVFIPENTTSTYGLFRSCASLTTIPESFTLPDNLINVGGMFEYCSSLYSIADDFHLPSTADSAALMFNGCSSLVSLPSGFYLPGTTKTSAGMFKGCSNLQALPEKFELPSGISAVDDMFNGCSSLSALPEGFSIPDKVTALKGMFKGCELLAALPEGFAIPRSLPLDEGKMNEMFLGCNSLTVLPSSFDFSIEAANASANPFMCANADTLTYFDGSPDSAVRQYDWTSQNRKLVLADDPDNPLPDTVHLVTFKLPDASGAYTEAVWLTSVTGTDGLLQEMAAPTREGYAFMGWFVDEACTIAFDFSKSVTDQAEGAPNPVTTLYARYAEARSTLPTTDGGEHASWKLTQDGTLRISCEDGYTIADLGWEPATSKTDYWGPMRSKVKRVQMHANVKAESMACWFMSMTDLTDVSGVFVPKGVASVSALFSGCSSLTALPDGFTVPEGVKALDGMMSVCTKLTALPEGFRIPESAELLTSMFEGSGIQSLPAGFTITKNVTDTRWMFQSCTQLTELPEGFQLPMDGKLEKAKNMFNMATGLKSIPVGYKIPASVTDCSYMFGSCRALTTIPEGFSLPNKGDLMAEYMFQSCNSLSVIPASLSLKGLMDAGWDPDTQGKEMFMVYSNQSPVISTLYMGKASDMPEAAWWKKQRRTLYFADDPDNPLPSGMKTVTFKTASLTTPGQWDDYATMLTDESGKLTQPGDPRAFGYPFKGWYTNEACTAKFDFSKQITADDVVVYGAFGAPILRGTVPLEANVVVDNAGGSTTASAEIRSFTPVDIDLTSVSCETGPGIAELFSNEADRTKPFATVKFPDQAEPVKASFTGQPAATSVTIPLSTGWASPGTKDCDISLDLNGAQVKHRIEDYAAQVANIVWTVEVKK